MCYQCVMRKWVYGIFGLFLWIVCFFIVPAIFEFNPLAQYDLRRYCDFVTGYRFAPAEDVAGSAEDAYRLGNFPLYSQAARNIRFVTSNLNPEQRWEAFKQGAGEVGWKEYDCPALREYLKR